VKPVKDLKYLALMATILVAVAATQGPLGAPAGAQSASADLAVRFEVDPPSWPTA
jgi:hypothetical protein